ncbi:carbohydrate sulfotransferase 5-like [Pecten maximus]|uniref:carbohydrate sulfotransferase 5-like n=1 Tax=Pecten maximus TaxID=6579 RepID=UPI001457E9E2|nr:carbohydrate sulfotransferase 5-like [Pecten maximus]
MQPHCRRFWARHPSFLTPRAIALWVVLGAGLLYYSLTSLYDFLYPTRNRSMVLVVAYMRSGSSLVGDILQHHQSSFYVFEPLRSATELAYSNQSITFYNSSVRKYTSPEEITQLHAELLYNWFTCNFSDLDLGSLTSDYLRFYSASTLPYHNCLRRYGGDVSSVKYCLGYIQSYCDHKELRTIKTIRLNLKTVDILLKWLPRLRVIHLIRDPRAIIHSRVRVKLLTWEKIQQEAIDLCAKISTDIPLSMELKQKYPERFKILLYENLAERPEEVSHRMYTFAGIEIKAYVVGYVRYLTLYGRGVDCFWCTQRGNSKRTSLLWRIYTLYAHVRAIDEVCGRVYHMTGYQPITNETTQLRNLSHPLRKTVRFTGDSL